MEIDKLFKVPAISAGVKRKNLPDLPSAEILKRFRPDETESKADVDTKHRVVTVEDDVADVPQNALEADDHGDDDEDGRFFGGGLNDEQNQILDIFDKAGDEEQDGTALSLPALRRLLGRFDRAVTRNAEQRGKYPDDPTKFIDSESDLDALLKQFLPLTQNPTVYYPELVNSGAVRLLVNLLSHENADIAVDVVEVLQELTDEDVGEEAEAEDDEEANDEGLRESAAATRLAVAQLIDELLGQSILDLLVSNLKRLNEAEETDRQGVFQILGIFENLLNFMPPLADEVGSSTDLLAWLIDRMKASTFDSNKQYASEILSILLQSPRNVAKVIKLNGVDALLTAVSRYRKADPQDSEEQEYMENAFDCLCHLVAVVEGKEIFLEAEGIELMVIIMKQKLLARYRAVKVLDYALQTEAGSANCERFVEVLGLKSLFPIFMGKGDKKKGKAVATFEDDEHILGILASLLTNLASDTAPRIRLIAKFVESDYEKVDRLLEIRDAAGVRVSAIERRVEEERQAFTAAGEEIDEDQEQEWYLSRLGGGLAALQTADYVLAWICMEDDGVLAHVKRLLQRKGKSLSEVRAVLQERFVHIEDDEDDPSAEAAQERTVLQALVSFLGP